MRYLPQAVTAASINAAIGAYIIQPTSITLASTGYLGWSSRFVFRAAGSGEVSFRDFAETIQANLAVEANDILSQRRGLNAQQFKVYNTYTDASNYERFRVGYVSNILKITGEAAGTGVTRALQLSPDQITTIEMEGNTLTGSSLPITMFRNGTSANTLLQVGGTNYTSTALNFVRLAPVINQASGVYNILDINPTETLIGAGPHYLIRGRIGGGGDVFNVGNAGDVTGRTITVSKYARVTAQTYSQLASPAGAGAGAFAYITDATATTRLSTAAGGGANKVMVWSDGTNWLIF